MLSKVYCVGRPRRIVHAAKRAILRSAREYNYFYKCVTTLRTTYGMMHVVYESARWNCPPTQKASLFDRDIMGARGHLGRSSAAIKQELLSGSSVGRAMSVVNISEETKGFFLPAGDCGSRKVGGKIGAPRNIDVSQMKYRYESIINYA